MSALDSTTKPRLIWRDGEMVTRSFLARLAGRVGDCGGVHAWGWMCAIQGSVRG